MTTVKTTQKIKIKSNINHQTVKSVNDAAFTSANQATINLMKESQPVKLEKDAAQPLEQLHQDHQKEKQRKLLVDRKQRRQEIERDKDDQEQEQEQRAQKRPTTRAVPIIADNFEIPIERLEEYTCREDEDQLFATRITQTGRPINEVIISTPPASEVLRYAREKAGTDKWFGGMQNFISQTPAVDYPDVPVVSRKLLVHLLREPNPANKWERPCFNLDRNPLPYEKSTRCIAHVMSEELLGAGNGFRLRELLLTDTMVRINESIDKKLGSPMDHLSPVPEMCYLCHLWTSLRDCIEQRDHIRERNMERKDFTQLDVVDVENNNNNVVIINRFMVVIDKEGEYDREKMISGDLATMGIWGPVPLFNRTNYAYTANYQGTGLRGFMELDKLLFRLARVSLDRTESSQKTTSFPSIRTSNASLNTLSLP